MVPGAPPLWTVSGPRVLICTSADAQRRRHPVTLFITETTGALGPDLCATLRALDGLSRAKTSTDYTTYGTARSSPHRFYAHHSAAISAAIVFADARTIDAAAAHMSWLVSVGVTP